MGIVAYLVRLISRTLINIFLIGLRATLFMLPYLIQLLRFIGWLLIRLASLSVLSLFIGVPTTIRRMAASWTGRAIAFGIPVEHDLALYRLMAVVAFAVLLSGWIVIGLAVWLVWTRMLPYM